MALFTDGLINAIIDLQTNESSILTVASTADVDLAGKMALAQEDITNQLLLFLLRRWANLDAQWAQRRTRGVSDVVVTAPLRQWHVHKTLALVYRDVYNSQVNDRYLGKWNEYEALAKVSCENYFRIGVGIAADPLSKPAPPLLSTGPGGGSAMTYYVAAAWVNAASQESSASEVGQISTSEGEQVTITPANPPPTASGWNVYIGETPDTVTLQNQSPIGINASWTTSGVLAQGRQVGRGQQATWFLVDYQVIERG
jgi:hypothetical protein